MKKALSKYIESKKVVGIGTGNTMVKYIKSLPLSTTYVPSSNQSMIALGNANLKVSNLSLYSALDVYVDSADFFDHEGNLIKGKGGSLTIEKLMCAMAKEVVIIVQDYKYREKLDDCFVPFEILPSALGYMIQLLDKRKLRYVLRTGNGKAGPTVTDLGNFIIDIQFDKSFIEESKTICGIIEHGYFSADTYSIKVDIVNKHNKTSE